MVPMQCGDYDESVAAAVVAVEKDAHNGKGDSHLVTVAFGAPEEMLTSTLDRKVSGMAHVVALAMKIAAEVGVAAVPGVVVAADALVPAGHSDYREGAEADMDNKEEKAANLDTRSVGIHFDTVVVFGRRIAVDNRVVAAGDLREAIVVAAAVSLGVAAAAAVMHNRLVFFAPDWKSARLSTSNRTATAGPVASDNSWFP